jgi:CRP/FNR family cyclic AMP-dependent transcriptional regulator
MEENVRPLSDIPAINRFLSYCRIRTVPSKTVLIHAGDLPDVLYYIISGSVEVMIEDEEGNEMVLAYLNKGQFFGEMGLFYEQPTRSAWVRTRNACELAEMTYPRFRQVATESPGPDLRAGHAAGDRVWIAPIASSATWPSSMSPDASRMRSPVCATSRTP